MDRIRIGRQLAGKYLVALTALFVVGLGLGLVIARLAVGEPKVSQTEYAILTAQIYEREHNLPAATERLASVGITEPSRSLPEMARRHATGTTAQSREAQSLRDLGRAFGATVDVAGSPATSSQPIWLVTVVVFVFVLLLGGALCYRVLGVRLPASRESKPIGEVVAEPPLPAGASALMAIRGFWRRVVAVFAPLTATRSIGRVASRAPRAANSAQHAATAPVRANVTNSVTAAAGSSPTSRSASDWSTSGERRNSLAPRGPARVTPRGQFRFRSSYDFGDEPYDEIHPIADPRTMALVGACGVSAVHRLQPTRGDVDSGSERYWGFTAWVQDYASDDQQLRSIGLVSRWAYVNCGAEIDVWLRSGQVDELRQVDVGTPIRLETTNIAAALTIEEFEHGDGVPTDAYIERLTTQFEVTLRPRQETSASGAPSGLGSQGSTARA